MRLGIDFGTTNSAAAVYDGQQLHPVEITTPQRSALLPSLLYIDRQQHAKMGLEASAEYVAHETGRGRRLGEIKASPLSRETGWSQRFSGSISSGT